MKYRFDIELIKKQCKDNNLTFLEIIPGKKNQVHCKCNNCGADIKRTIDKWKIRQNCTSCNKKKINDFEERKETFINFVKNTKDYEYISGFVDDRTKVKIKHLKCNTEYYVTPNHFKMGRRCPHCNGGVSYSKEKFEELFFLTHSKDEYELLSDYKNSTTPIKIKHKLCNSEYTIKNPCIAIERKTGCPYCYGHLKKSFEELKKQVSEIDNGEYELVDDFYENNYIHLRHKKCGTEYTVLANNFINKNWGKCPRCFPSGTSIGEKEILDFVKEIGFENAQSVRKTINKINSQMDIFIPEKNIGIEFDGLYFHSDKLKDKLNLFLKMKNWNSIGVRVINIFEDEWKFKKEIVKEKLKHILKVDTSKKIFARKCRVIELNSKERNIFLGKYHIQGTDRANISYGLKYNDELVAVMSFSKQRSCLGNKTKKESVYELSRFATSCNVVGGFSKLFKYFKDNNTNIKKVITYADLRWSSDESNVYSVNGFKKVDVTKPNYWYFDRGSLQRYHRYNFRKQILKTKFPDLYSDDLTEFQIMDKTKYMRIWDCGNLVYEWTRG